MELKWLEDFLCVAKLRNFSNAAKERHATQPALSRRIRSLEAWYGVPLIDRSTYPVELTQDGASLVPVAERIVADLNRARRDARLRAGRAQTALRFAMPHSLAVVFFPAWWRERQYAGPATVVAADFDLCVERLLEGDCQFLMCYRHTAAPDGLAARGVRGVSIGQDRLLSDSLVHHRHVHAPRVPPPPPPLPMPKKPGPPRDRQRLRSIRESSWTAALFRGGRVGRGDPCVDRLGRVPGN